MADNLKDKERVFLYILIVGDEIDKENIIEEAVLKDIVKGVALDAGRKYLEQYGIGDVFQQFTFLRHYYFSVKKRRLQNNTMWMI